MSNMTISDNTAQKLDMLSEVTEQIKVLNTQKSKLQTEVLADLGMENNAPLGTSSFEDVAGSVRAKIAVSEELVLDDAGIASSLKALEKAGLMDTVVSMTFKIDKKAFEKLPDAKKSALAPFVAYKRKKPTLTVL